MDGYSSTMKDAYGTIWNEPGLTYLTHLAACHATDHGYWGYYLWLGVTIAALHDLAGIKA